MKIEKINRKLLYLSFGIYLSIVLWIVLLKYANYDSIVGIAAFVNKNNIQERFLAQFSYDFNFIDAFKNLGNWINFIIFIPLGLYLPLLFNKYNFLRDLFIVVFSVVFIETWQLLSGFGMMSLLDLFNNTLGLIFGSLLYLIFKFLNHPKAVNIINVVAIVVGVPLVVFATTVTFINLDLYKYFPWFGIYNEGKLIDEEGAPLIDISNLFFY